MLLPEYLSGKRVHAAPMLKILLMACPHLRISSKCLHMICNTFNLSHLFDLLPYPTSPLWVMPFSNTQLLAVYEFAWGLRFASSYPSLSEAYPQGSIALRWHSRAGIWTQDDPLRDPYSTLYVVLYLSPPYHCMLEFAVCFSILPSKLCYSSSRANI